MEEKLIEEIKKHTALFRKDTLEYRNRRKRAEAWLAVSEAVGSSESACQTRWRSLRDRFVKEFAKHHHASGSAADLPESPWEFYPMMEFMAEHVKPRRTTTSLASSESYVEASSGSRMEAALSPPFPASHTASTFSVFGSETFTDSVIETEVLSNSADQPQSTPSGKGRKRGNCDDVPKFLERMAEIAEKRFCAPAPSIAGDEHEGFFSMVRGLFAKLPEHDVDDAKMQFLNSLHEQIKANRK